jgi:acyl carrier protein
MLEQDVIWSRLNEVFADVLDVPEVQLERSTSAADIPEWDSIAHVRLMIAVEKTFGFRMRTGEIAALRNVGDLVDMIATRATK